jgi:hypothetical protein
MRDLEKLGAFYLGRLYDAESRRVTDEPLLYDAKDLTTHAVIVGMTGSGKTGLGVALLEEAALDGVPALVLDPKGDMGNLLLAFPQLRAEDFLPWVSAQEATRSGQTPEQLAASTAGLWRRGLADWGQGEERVARYCDAVDRAIYTPGGGGGRQLRVLQSFAAPPAALRDDVELITGRVDAAVGGLLSLLGKTSDPVTSREHVLLANILHRAWRKGRDLDLGTLVQQIIRPQFEQLGVLDLETFYPARERQALALELNALIASPSFAPWLTGEPLDVGRLLYTAEGRPRIAVCSLAHLSDEQRMFFVTLLLGELVTWMRAQPGTGSLRALLYMDEIFGFFPPSAAPPSKAPMLSLLKQARAYGLGVVLATQNPADLDYKGLANCGTWLVGRLQTERDRERLLDGLQGPASAGGRAWGRAELGRLLGGLGKRVFLMSNAHEDEAVLFHTRWVLSYLAGPLTRQQIERLMPPPPEEEKSAAERTPPSEEIGAAATEAQSVRPAPPPEVGVAFLPLRERGDSGAAGASGAADVRQLVYRPALLARAQLHFKRASATVDEWRELAVLAPIAPGARSPDWQGARLLPFDAATIPSGDPRGRFAPLASAAKRSAFWSAARKRLVTFLYREQTLTLFSHPGTKSTSHPGEGEGELRIRVKSLLAERRDREVEKVKQRYASRLASLRERIRADEERVERERSQLRDRGGRFLGAQALERAQRRPRDHRDSGRESLAPRSSRRGAGAGASAGAAQEARAARVRLHLGSRGGSRSLRRGGRAAEDRGTASEGGRRHR